LQPWAIHLVASQVNTPWAECVVIGNAGDKDPLRSLFPYLTGVPLPKNGFIAPSDLPGVGVEVNEEWLGE
jgi:hypothetical protein